VGVVAAGNFSLTAAMAQASALLLARTIPLNAITKSGRWIEAEQSCTKLPEFG
jgi:hypothetical protein